MAKKQQPRYDPANVAQLLAPPKKTTIAKQVKGGTPRAVPGAGPAAAATRPETKGKKTCRWGFEPGTNYCKRAPYVPRVDTLVVKYLPGGAPTAVPQGAVGVQPQIVVQPRTKVTKKQEAALVKGAKATVRAVGSAILPVAKKLVKLPAR